MNKEEIEHRIKKYELVRDCAEENLNEIKKQLAEAEKLEKLDKFLEKPKLRHGDWWLTKEDKGEIRIFMKEYNNEKRDCVALRCALITNIGSEYEGQPILGNVFDLMKGWDKPFKEWGDDRASKGVKIVGNRIEFYACTDGSCSKSHSPCSENAEEFHNALGHAIAELKRKQGD